MAKLVSSRSAYDPMYESRRMMALHGAGLGIVAGLIFAGGEVLAATLMASPPLLPLQMFASIALGEAALSGAHSLRTMLLVGGLVHVALSASFGALYSVFLSYRARETQTGFAREAGMGMLYGLVLWAFNFYIVAPALFPWFLQAPPLTQALLHATCYGLPLGMMFAAATRRLALPAPYEQTPAYPRPRARIHPKRRPRP